MTAGGSAGDALFRDPLPEGFSRRVVRVAPGFELGVEPDRSPDALVVVEQGGLELVCSTGTCRRFGRGSLIPTAGLRLSRLRSVGPGPLVLVVVSRARPPTTDEFRRDLGSYGESSRSEDAMSELSGTTTIVVGASRGLGHGIATAFAEAGAPVIAVSRTAAVFPVPDAAAGSIRAETADAGEATVPARLLGRYAPQVVVLVAGASPHMRPLQQQTWDTFSVNWQTDVRITFHWLREALLRPLEPGSKVVVISSGAALNGSPLSGGYAGAKATQRFMTGYAQDEANRAGLEITFTTVLPRFAPSTGVGRPAVEAYAARAGQAVDEFLEHQGPLVSPEIAGAALVELVKTDAPVAPAYLLTGDGLRDLT